MTIPPEPLMSPEPPERPIPLVLAHRDDGPPDAPVLVLLGSIGSTTAMWEPIMGPLTERLRVIRLDHRGHGSSPAAPPGTPAALGDLAADVLATMDAVVGDRRVHLAGVSLGGMVTQWIAAHAPHRVARILPICTSALLGPAQNWTDRAATARTGGLGSIADTAVTRWLTPAGLEHDPSLGATVRAMVTSTDPESYAQCCEAIGGMDLRPDLARIAAPTLVVAGALDPSTPPEHAEVIVSGMAGARLVVLPDVAHVPTWEAAGALAELVLGHLSPDPLTAGFATRRAVLGDAHVDRSIARTTEFTRPFQDFITRYAWGDVWTRPGLVRRERSIATLAALTAIGAEGELALHVRAARTNGLTWDEIAEVLLHTAVYGGVPRSNAAFALADRIRADEIADA